MRCSAGCGERAEVIVTRETEQLVLLLCRGHARAFEAIGCDVRAMRTTGLRERGA